MTFTSNDNKQLLWDLINETGMFDKVAPNYNKQTIIQMFEEMLNKIDIYNLSLTEKNKLFLSEYVKKLNYLKIENTKDDLQKHREHMFEERLKLKQDEFRKYMQPPKPPIINFLEPEQDAKIDYIDLTSKIKNNSVIDMNEVTEVKKKVTFKPDFDKHDNNDIDKPDKYDIILSELKEIKELLLKLNHS